MKAITTQKFKNILKKMQIQLQFEIKLQIRLIQSNPNDPRLTADLSNFRARKFNQNSEAYRIAYVGPSLGSNKYFKLANDKTIIICYLGKHENFTEIFASI